MLTDAAAAGDLAYHIQQQVREAAEYAPHSVEGWIVGSSYKTGDASAELLFGATYPILGDDGDAYINYTSLPLITTQPGDLYGPTGLEHTIAIPTESGYALFYKHGPYDTPSVPPGERWILHKNTATQAQADTQATWDAGAQWTNDGPTSGDGLGGSHLGYQGAYTTNVTNSGHIIALNDTAQTISATTAAGHTYVFQDPTPIAPQGSVILTTIGGLKSVFDDATQSIQHIAVPGLSMVVDALGEVSGLPNSISHVVPTGGLVGLGELAGSLSVTANAATRFSDLSDAMTNQITQMIGNSHIQLLTAIVTAGGLPTGASATALLATLASSGFPIPSFFTLLSSLSGITIPACSQTVLIK